MVSYEEISREELIDILKTYIDSRYHNIEDFDRIIDNATVFPEWNDVLFEFNSFNLYLDTRDLSYRDAEPREGL